jgi:hypothetical protein
MIILPLSCTCSDLKVYLKNWISAKVSIKKDWYVYYRFYDPVFKENPIYKIMVDEISHSDGDEFLSREEKKKLKEKKVNKKLSKKSKTIISKKIK